MFASAGPEVAAAVAETETDHQTEEEENGGCWDSYGQHQQQGEGCDVEIGREMTMGEWSKRKE